MANASRTIVLGGRTVPVALGVLTQPVGANNGSPLATQPIVRVLDGVGVPVNASGFVVTVSINSGAGNFTGGSTLTVITNSAGQAVFTNLTVSGTGTFTLAFQAPGLSGVTSAPFTMSSSGLLIAGPGANFPAGQGLTQIKPSQTFQTGQWSTVGNANLADAAGWYGFFGNSGFSFISDGTNPVQGLSTFFRHTIPAGSPGGSAQNTAVAGYEGQGGNHTKLYVRVIYRIVSNWSDNGNTGTKFCFFNQQNSDNHYFNLTDFSVWSQGVNLQGTFGYGTLPSPNNIVSPAATKGQWLDAEYFLQLNTLGVYNGIARTWNNGVLRQENTAMGYKAGGSTPNIANVLYYSPTYGGGSNNTPYPLTIDIAFWGSWFA